ncbi:MAG TPA: YtxH domain-containing protein, partial [Thermodesulfobacteriota bacterium]|nr:YtxH domain-containing protein [Thermodesulfobacteriota bacterium]
MSTDRSALFAFLLGGVIGAGLALLYAPASGHETRKRIRHGAEDAEDWARDSFRDTLGGAKERLSEGTEKVRHMLSEKKGDLQDAFHTGVEAF